MNPFLSCKNQFGFKKILWNFPDLQKVSGDFSLQISFEIPEQFMIEKIANKIEYDKIVIFGTILFAM